MSNRILAVPTAELNDLLGARRFLGLPAEEAERLYASIEVLAVEPGDDPAVTPLVAFTAVHYNYSWLTYRDGGSSARAIGMGSAIAAQAHECLFLDESMKAAASRQLAAAIATPSSYVLRFAGLLHDGRHLGLVYLARLRQPGAESRDARIASIRFCGNGDLQRSRAEFEPWSQTFIDNLSAF
jgi:hypothetical protein